MEHEAEQLIYGSVSIFRMYCEDCQQMAFVIDEEFQCCSRIAPKPTRLIIKRISEASGNRAIKKSVKDKVIARQDNECIYCKCELGDVVWDDKKQKIRHEKVHFDHFIPYSFVANSNEDNIVASCPRCNLCKHDKMFDTIDEARTHILKRRKENEKTSQKNDNL